MDRNNHSVQFHHKIVPIYLFISFSAQLKAKQTGPLQLLQWPSGVRSPELPLNKQGHSKSDYSAVLGAQHLLLAHCDRFLTLSLRVRVQAHLTFGHRHK